MEKNDTDLPDIGWLMFKLTQIHEDINLLYNFGHSDLKAEEFKVIDSALFKAIETIGNMGKQSKVIVTNDNEVHADLVCNGVTPIFVHYWSCPLDVDFKSYFYKNLNPDYAPVGFLEQLDGLLQLAKQRPLVIFARNDKQEMSYCATIKEYIEAH